MLDHHSFDTLLRRSPCDGRSRPQLSPANALVVRELPSTNANPACFEKTDASTQTTIRRLKSFFADLDRKTQTPEANDERVWPTHPGWQLTSMQGHHTIQIIFEPTISSKELVVVDVHRLAADEAAPTASSWKDDLATVFV